MLPKLHYRPTHWVNGMKITENHLVNQENFIADQLRDTLALNLTNFNFGLLPGPNAGPPSFDVEVNTEWIEVNSCRAVTAGGVRIEISPGEAKELKMPTRQLLGNQAIPEDSTWYVVLRVNPFERFPVGTINPNEVPLRHPHTRPGYKLDIIPVERVSASEFSAFQLPLAKIQGSRGGLRVMEDYIPPCARMDCHPDLAKYHRDFTNRLQHLQESVLEVIDNLHRQQLEEHTLNPLAQDIRLLMEGMASFLANTIDYYRLLAEQDAPLFLIERFARFARVIDQSLRLMQSRETFLEYCRLNFDLLPTDWDFELCDLQYNHLEIKQTLDKVIGFLDMQEQRFLKKLSQMRSYTLLQKKANEYDPLLEFKLKQQAKAATDATNGDTRNNGNSSWFKSLIE
jgi:hypothetical protein